MPLRGHYRSGNIAWIWCPTGGVPQSCLNCWLFSVSVLRICHIWTIINTFVGCNCPQIPSWYIANYNELYALVTYMQNKYNIQCKYIHRTYSETWELGTPKGLRKIVLNCKVVLFLRSISTYWIRLGTEVTVLNSQGVPISQVVLKTGSCNIFHYLHLYTEYCRGTPPFSNIKPASFTKNCVVYKITLLLSNYRHIKKQCRVYIYIHIARQSRYFCLASKRRVCIWSISNTNKRTYVYILIHCKHKYNIE